MISNTGCDDCGKTDHHGHVTMATDGDLVLSLRQTGDGRREKGGNERAGCVVETRGSGRGRREGQGEGRGGGQGLDTRSEAGVAAVPGVGGRRAPLTMCGNDDRMDGLLKQTARSGSPQNVLLDVAPKLFGAVAQN